jgi:hypothetical protein
MPLTAISRNEVMLTIVENGGQAGISHLTIGRSALPGHHSRDRERPVITRARSMPQVCGRRADAGISQTTSLP